MVNHIEMIKFIIWYDATC